MTPGAPHPAPSGKATRLRRLYRELRRRHVIRVSVAYLAGAFLLWQVADLLFEALPVPDWSLTLVVAVTIVGFPLAVLLAWALQITPEGVVLDIDRAPTSDGSPADVASPAADLSSKRIAVLPFANLSPGSGDDYFVDGLMEELIFCLARISDLTVVSRTSAMAYRGVAKTASQIGRELAAGSIVEGSVRRLDDRVRVVAQLIDATDDSHVWAETYDRELTDVLGLQAEVAEQIAGSLHAELTDAERDRLESTPTENPKAFDLFLRAREAWNLRSEDGLARSIELLDAALVEDPDYVKAHGAKADSFLTMALYGAAAPQSVLPRARDSADRALALDPSFGEALPARASVAAVYDWDWEGAEADFLRARSLAGGHPTTHQWYAMHLLAPLARFDEARDALAQARSLDPYSAAIESSVVFVDYLEGRFQAAEDGCHAMMSSRPSFPLGFTFLGQILMATGQADQAVSAFRSAAGLRPSSPEAKVDLAHALALAGHGDEAAALLEQVEGERDARYVSAARLALLRQVLDHPAQAAAELERARRERSTDLIWAGRAAWYDPLRKSQAFVGLMKTMALSPGASARPT